MTSPAMRRHELPFSADLMGKLLVETAGFPGADFRVLTYYATAVPLGETVRDTAKTVAETVQISPGSVSKSIARLVPLGWLAFAFRVGSVNFYRVGDKVLELAETEVAQEAQPLATVSHLPVRDFSDDE
ncbi:MarR family transcriptional regulator [Streptomyces sp. NPDC058548]|uniref:MarR family transcriptional regulator n=1 Tax=Streptomyces sp. NPDC058548 TaxID=3346545 RepID=UPI003664BF2F